jgi:choline-sulfatase
MKRLASRGVLFSRAHSANPVCVPSRAALMTGRYPSEVGSYCNSTPFDGRVPTWGTKLRDAGYSGMAIGKLDLVGGKDYGFREVGTTHDHDPNPDVTSLFRRPLCYRVDERPLVNGEFADRIHVDDGRTRRLLEFLRADARRSESPWSVFLGLELPHHPYVAHRRFAGMYPAQSVPMPDLPAGHLEQLHLALQAQRNFKLLSEPVPADRVARARSAYLAMVTELDEYLGMILDELDRSGLRDSTIVVYTSDHGEMLGEHGLWLKNNLLDDSVRVPLILAGPGVPAGRVIDTPVSHVDLVATLLDFGGGDATGLHGRSLRPLMAGEQGGHPGWAYAESHSEGNLTGSFMIRKGPWKYIHFSWFPSLLFNTDADPGEFRNLAGSPEAREVEKELREILLSRVDPEQITEAAFREQERRLGSLVRNKTADEFYRQLLKRLGPGQAGAFTNRHYPGFRGPRS